MISAVKMKKTYISKNIKLLEKLLLEKEKEVILSKKKKKTKKDGK